MNVTLSFRLGPARIVAVRSIEAASRVFREWVDAEGFGASDLGRGAGEVREGGRLIARVAYNGRVFGPGEWTLDAVPLFDPYTVETEDEARDWHIRRDERNGRRTP